MAACAPCTHIEAAGTQCRVDFCLCSLGCPLRRAKGMVANWPSAWGGLSVLPPDPVLA